MKRLLTLTVLASVLLPLMLSAQVTEAAALRAPMSSLYLSPRPPGPSVAGTGTISFIVQRDATGVVTSAVVDSRANVQLGQQSTVVAVEICEGSAGETGAVVLDVGPPNPVSMRQGNIRRTVEVTDATGLAAVEAILANPGGYYMIVRTQARQSGAMRGQLESTTQTLDAIEALDAKVDGIKAETDKIAALEAKIDALAAMIRLMARYQGVSVD